MKTAEEILNKWCQFDRVFADGDFLFPEQRIRVLKAMEEYASQFKHEIKFPSEEEINHAVKSLGKESTAPDKDTPDWMMADIRRGIYWLINWIKENNA